jgi:hypothetical protein
LHLRGAKKLDEGFNEEEGERENENEDRDNKDLGAQL